jgi:hypothetical protein
MHLSIFAAVVLAALLASTGLVHSWPTDDMRVFEYFDNSLIQDLDDTFFLGPDGALDLIDRICSQEKDADGTVSGAINRFEKKFLTWEKYREGPGRDYDPNYYHRAHAQWETFKVYCFWHQYAAWYETGLVSTSSPETNYG